MKGDFAGVFGHAVLRSFTEDTIKAAFAATGVHPFDPAVIPKKAMKPSLPTSTRGSFPLPQPSPVRAIIATMGNRPPTNFELSPTTHSALIAGPSRIPASPKTPSNLRRVREPDVDPNLETPSKRLQIMYSELGSTLSGSMLVSKVCMMSMYKVTAPVFEAVPELPQPDWGLLYRSSSAGYQSRASLEQQNQELTESLDRSRHIIRTHKLMEEGQSAHLIIQHAHLVKLNQSLNAKENKKGDRTTLFTGGLGRHLTDSEVTDQLIAQNQRKEAKAAEKAKRKSGREADAAARAAVEAE